jgi:cell division protein FtsN
MALSKARMAPVADPAAEARYRLQLGAFREEALAEKAWREVSAVAGPVIGGAGHAIQRADLGEKGVFYRLQAGAFGEAAAAKSACKALERQKIACFVVEG